MVQTTSYDLGKLKGGIQVWENNTEKLTAQVDLRAFYKEMFTTLINEGFIDGSQREAKALQHEAVETFGVLVNPANDKWGGGIKGTRHNGMFEQKYRLVKQPDGKTHDYETDWYFRKKTPVLGWWYNFQISIACRNYQNIEVINGNSKKVLQSGTWEFRNQAFMQPSNEEFKNIEKKLKILEPFVSAKRMENIMLNHIWFKKIQYDKLWCKKTANGYVYKVINKHFKNGG